MLLEQYDLFSCCGYHCCEESQQQELITTTTTAGVEQPTAVSWEEVSGVEKQRIRYLECRYTMTHPVKSDDGFSFLTMVSTSQMWTGVLVICLVLFLVAQTAVKMKRHNRILPMLLKMSGGPFSSTTVGSEGIILPSLVYRQDRRDTRLMWRKNTKDELDKSLSNKDTEILNVFQLIEKTDEKLIDLEQNEARATRPGSTVRRLPVEWGPGGGPLEAAYQPGRVVREVWGRAGASLGHLYRYTNLDNLVCPPGYLFRQHSSTV